MNRDLRGASKRWKPFLDCLSEVKLITLDKDKNGGCAELLGSRSNAELGD